MKRFILFFTFLCALFVSLTSAIAIAPSGTPGNEKLARMNASIDEALRDGKLTYTELKVAAELYKGKALSLREKLMLRVFKNKIIQKAKPYSGEGKSQLVALLLCLFVGGIGIHRFYLGYTWQGIVQILTLGGLGIWTLIDLIRIITGSLQPKDGEYGKTL